MKKGFCIENKKATFLFEVLEKLEAGLQLTGEEIKAIRAGKVQITGAYVKIINNEAHLLGAHFNLGEEASSRSIKLLLHKKEIGRLLGLLSKKGYSAFPLKIFEKRGLAKLLVGIGKGKKLYQKKETLKKRDLLREEQQALKSFR